MKLKLPLVLFVFGDHYLINLNKVEESLYGITHDEIMHGGRDSTKPTTTIHIQAYYFLEMDRSPYQNLAAVVYCDWFDTLNLEDEGKRLKCIVLHNWTANTALPIEAFGNFGQITWLNSDDGRLIPHVIGDMSIVSKFTDGGTIKMVTYSYAMPRGNLNVT